MIIIRKGTKEDTEPFIELLSHVKQNMEHKEWLYLDSPDEVREIMRNGTCASRLSWSWFTKADDAAGRNGTGQIRQTHTIMHSTSK